MRTCHQQNVCIKRLWHIPHISTPHHLARTMGARALCLEIITHSKCWDEILTNTGQTWLLSLTLAITQGVYVTMCWPWERRLECPVTDTNWSIVVISPTQNCPVVCVTQILKDRSLTKSWSQWNNKLLLRHKPNMMLCEPWGVIQCGDVLINVIQVSLFWCQINRLQLIPHRHRSCTEINKSHYTVFINDYLSGKNKEQT